MDAATLSALLASSTATLTALHAKLGCPPSALEAALDQLRAALQQAVDAQLEQSRLDVEAAEKGCASRVEEVMALRDALGLKREVGEVGVDKPLLARMDLLDTTLTSLRDEYQTRTAQVTSLRSQLDTYVPLLSTFMPSIPAQPTSSAPNQSAPISSSYIEALRASLRSAEAEHAKRTGELRAHLLAILQLWSELCILPDCSTSPTTSSAASAGAGVSDDFSARVLSHLRLRVIPPSTPGEEWDGNFASLTEEEEGDTSLSSPPSSPSARSRPSGPLTATLTQPNHALPPNASSLKSATRLRAALEEEKTRREARIQELYDELYALWERFGVPETEMEAFVLANSGATESAIEAYALELAKMRELKAQHMALFISSIRERIALLWDELQLGASERHSAFPSFFLDLSDDGTASAGAVVPSDELLAAHEQYEDLAKGELERKAPLLAMVAQYQALLEEGAELERAAADKDRLKGKRGRPGALLEEEKTRKRLKTLKPKLEEKLLRAIPAWEEETGRAFMIDGQRYVEELQAAVGPATTSNKRTRILSGSSTSSLPPLSSSALSNRAGTATPLRTNAPPAAKKARLGSASVSASARATPATATRRAPPRSAGGAASGLRAPASVARATRAAPASAASGSNAGGFGWNANAAGASSTTRNASAGVAAVPVAASSLGSTYRAVQGFRPRPSSNAPATASSVATGQWSAVPRYAQPTPGLPRQASDQSLASDATTLVHAPSSHAALSSTHASAQRRGPRPSLSLEGSLAARTAGASAYAKPSQSGAGATIRSISSSSAGSTGAGQGRVYSAGDTNWTRLDEDEEEEEEWEQGEQQEQQEQQEEEGERGVAYA